MKRLLAALLFLCTTIPAFATTWYIRPDGGTRYSANAVKGQCNGTADVSYASTGGTGINQNCAFNDFRFLYDDKSYNGIIGGWVIAGGDTVLVRGCYNPDGNGDGSTACRIGSDPPGIPDTWCVGNAIIACSAGPMPAGTPTKHTRILGQNYASCSTGNATNLSQLTQIFGGNGVGTAINLGGTQNVDFECIDLSDHSQCVQHGFVAFPGRCTQDTDDFAFDGIATNNQTANVLLQDVWIHGFSDSGISGPIGGMVTMTRVAVNFNGFAGWNFDDGSSTPDAPGSAIKASYVLMEGNGCNEEYPIAHTGFPAKSCYDLNSGGFGDSWSGQNTVLASFTCDHCSQIYNTKDGFIGPHTSITTLTITNSESIGNMGQQWKWGMTANSALVFTGNLTLGNCSRMSAQISGAVQNFNLSTGLPGSYLSDYCRASGDVFSFFSNANSTWLFANNTTVAYSATVFDLACGTAQACRTTPYIFRNNLILGYLNNNPAYLGFPFSQLPGLYFFSDTSDVVTADHNLEYNVRNGDCPSTKNVCADPLLVGEPASPITVESVLDNFDFYLSPASPAIGAGVSYSGMPPMLFDKTPMPSPPVIGALLNNLSPPPTVSGVVITGPVTFAGPAK